MAVTESVHQSAVSDSTVKATVERKPAANDAKVCWIELKRYPYHPDHQVELLHLQAEADALLIKLQASEQQKLAEMATV